METATLHQAAPGYSSACPVPYLEWRNRRYPWFPGLAQAMREAGVDAVSITPLEHSGQRWYYGEGGSRYLHDRRLVLRVTGEPDPAHYSQAGRDGYVVEQAPPVADTPHVAT